MNLKEARELKCMTQQELATAIGRDRSLITKIENKDTFPSVETAKAIGKVLDIDWTLFFKEIGEESSHRSQ
ncbi:MAG: helix-turn-helix transcriptional regulator [Candidatus Alkaliphilus sp. MAG34]